jgi:hypothetical protein
MPDETMWKEMLGTLKDISAYLEKQDEIEKQITQEKATIDKRPKAGETQDPIVGKGSTPSGSPETDKVITKEFVEKADSKEDEEEESEESSEDSEESEDTEELKSLLKDIREALVSQQTVVKAEISKALPSLVKSEVEKGLDKMLRKQGFTPTHPDVQRIGLDQTSEVKKSEDKEVESDIRKSEDDKTNEVVRAIDTLSKKDWRTLGQLRENAGQFRIF